MATTLYGYWRSSSAWRVRIALHHKGIAFDNVPVHLVADGGRQHSAEHRARNPMRQVPVLVVDGEPLTQSLAIIEYLDEAHPTPPLLPAGALARARVRQAAELVNSGIQPIQNLRVMQKLGTDFGADKAARVAWSHDWIRDGFVALEQLIERFGGTYTVGDSVSMADLCLVPQLYNARRFSVDLSAFPRTLAVEAALVGLPAFVAAHPDQQPDAVQ